MSFGIHDSTRLAPLLLELPGSSIGFRDAVNIARNTRLALRFYEFSAGRQFRVPRIPRCITRGSYSRGALGDAGRTSKMETIFTSVAEISFHVLIPFCGVIETC